jgi:RNA polymerase sigma factor (sigma-70 family)
MTDGPWDDDSTPKGHLGDISTSWRQIHDPLKFFLIYGPAVRCYLLSILRDEHDTEEVLQDLLVQVTERGFRCADPERGRFRDYLRTVVRNAAFRQLQRRAARPLGDEALDLVASEDEPDRGWQDEWRKCLLDKAWRDLERHQRAARGNLSYTVLRMSVDHADEDSTRLAARASELSGQPLAPAAFRKQLSRARRAFADLIAAEVANTLDDPSPEAVREELAAIELLDYLSGFMSADG